MVPRGYLMLSFLLMTISLIHCKSLWTENRDRRMPPPVMSFLAKMKAQESTRVKRELIDDHETREMDKEYNATKNTDTINNQRSSHQRQKRYVSSISMRGCHLGTCQIQNLASMLYRIGNNSFKEGSNRDTKDPLGYGRKRRSLLKSEKRTNLLAT